MVHQVKRIPLFTFNTGSLVSIVNSMNKLLAAQLLSCKSFPNTQPNVSVLVDRSFKIYSLVGLAIWYTLNRDNKDRQRERQEKRDRARDREREILFDTFYCFRCVCKNGLIKTIRWNVNQIECASKSKPQTFRKTPTKQTFTLPWQTLNDADVKRSHKFCNTLAKLVVELLL